MPVRMFEVEAGSLREIEADPLAGVPGNVHWIDLEDPTKGEEQALEKALGIDIRTREEVSQIETSSRLVAGDGSVSMTGIVITSLDTAEPEPRPITFIRSEGRLLTVHYGTSRSLEEFLHRCDQRGVRIGQSGDVLAALLETIVDRLADNLEHVGDELDKLDGRIFRHRSLKDARRMRGSVRERTHKLEAVLEQLGRWHRQTVKLRQSVQSFQRVVAFAKLHDLDRGIEIRMTAMEEDLRAIGEYSDSLGATIEFMLGACVGLIDIQQSKIINVLSVLGVIFTPPVLVASTYGMNFELMPELKWVFGYPYALGLMLLSAILPYFIFKWRGWF